MKGLGNGEIIYPFAEPKNENNVTTWKDMTHRGEGEQGTLDFIPVMQTYASDPSKYPAGMIENMQRMNEGIERAKTNGVKDGNLMNSAEEYGGSYNYEKRFKRIKELKDEVKLQDTLWENFRSYKWLQSEAYKEATTHTMMKKFDFDGRRMREELEALEDLHRYEDSF